MTFGEEGKEQARVHNLEDVKAILDVFQSHGHYEVCDLLSSVSVATNDTNQIDTARVYCGGTSEEYLGKIGWQERGLKMDTKLYPSPVRLVSPFICKHCPYSFLREGMRCWVALSVIHQKISVNISWHL